MSDQVTRLNRELKYKGSILELYDDTVLVGGREAHWDFIHHIGAAAVIPVTKNEKILMVRQFRNALDQEMLEIPAGKLNSPDEPMIDCALRELEEEIGYRSENVEFLMSVTPTVAYDDERIDIFVARDLIPSEQHLDEGEFLEMEEWDIKDLLDLIYNGEMTDGKSVAGLCGYALKYHVL